MSTQTVDERGIDLLLLVALQVRVERTSFLPKFLITSSFRATPFLTVTVLLLTSLSSLYQDTVGVGLPATMEKEKKKKKITFPRPIISKLFLSLSRFRILRPRIFLFRQFVLKGSSDCDDFFFSPSPRFLLSPTISGRVETYGLFVRSFHHRSFNPLPPVMMGFTKRNRDCIARGSFTNEGNQNQNESLITGDISNVFFTLRVREY